MADIDKLARRLKKMKFIKFTDHVLMANINFAKLKKMKDDENAFKVFLNAPLVY